MRNLVLTGLVLLATLSVAGQQTHRFVPKWKVGDHRSFQVESRETEYKHGALVTDTTITLDWEVWVLEESANDYLVKVRYEDVAYRKAMELRASLNKELPPTRDLELRYRIDKKTAEADLVNWQEVQAFVLAGLDQMQSVGDEQDTEYNAFAERLFAPIKGLLDSKESMEAYMQDEIGYLLVPFNKEFVAGDTLRVSDAGENPFRPGDTITVSTLHYLQNMESQQQRCEVHSELVYDLAEFRKMMMSIVMQFASAFGQSDSVANEASKAMDQIDFDMTNHQTIHFNTGTTWPTKVITTVKVVASDPKGRNESTVESVVTVD